MAGREGGDSERDDHGRENRVPDDRERVERLRQAARAKWGSASDDIDAITAHLEADDPEVRAQGAWALAELVAENPVRSRLVPVESKLAPLLDDEDEWVRRGASWALATVADEDPQRVRQALSEVTEGLADDDALVRENSVLALSDVAVEYPLAAEPALSYLADMMDDADGLARRYAAETLRRLVRQLEEDGFPKTIAATPELADLLPDGADVVEVTEDPSDGMPIQVRGGPGGGSGDEGAETGTDDEEIDETLGPPDEVPSPPEVEADHHGFERLSSLGDGPLTTAVKVRAATPSDGGQHVVASVRTLRPGVGVDTARVETAFRSWARLDDHDHIIPVLARGTDPRPWIATEFMDGGTLRDHLGAVGFERGLWYAHRVTTAICHGHARGVVHGALGPRVVGLSRTLGAWPVPKVGDWGLGDLFAELRELPVPPAYAAPEHVAPDRFGRPDPATDVYQLGALCYALFAGRPPFTGDPHLVVRKIKDDAPPPPTDVAPDLPATVDDLLARALTKEKRARFETAEDFRRELELLLDEYGQDDWY